MTVEASGSQERREFEIGPSGERVIRFNALHERAGWNIQFWFWRRLTRRHSCAPETRRARSDAAWITFC